MAVEKWTPERRRQLTRDTLIDAAAEVFVRRGFHGASLEEIAETAGFTRGAIYKNFADKDELFLAVNEKFNERMLAQFADLLDAEGPFDNLAAVAAKWRDMQAHNPDFLVLGIEFTLYELRNSAVHKRALEQRHELARRVARFMEEQAAAAGVAMPIPVEDLAWIFLITTEGFNHATLIEPELGRLYEPFLELLATGAWGSVPST